MTARSHPDSRLWPEDPREHAVTDAGTTEKGDRIIRLLSMIGLVEISRTGIAAMDWEAEAL